MVEAVGPQRIPDVNHGKDARYQRDLFAFQAERVARAVPLLMMGVRDVDRLPQVTDGREHFVGKNRMLSHDDPFFLGQRIAFEQDLIGDAHFADVMQQRAPTDLHQLLIAQSEQAGQLDGQLSGPLGVPFRLVAAQFQCPRPPFDGGVIRLGKLLVRTLQVVEQGNVIDRDRRLGGQGFEEVKPLAVVRQLRALEDFEHPHDLSLRYQRHPVVTDEILTRQKHIAQKTILLLCKVRDMNDAAFLCRPPGITLAQRLAGVFDGFRVKPATGNVFQRPRRGVEQQNVGCVSPQLNNDMGEERFQAEIQLKTEINGAVDLNQGGQMLKIPLDPFLRGLDIADIRKHHHNLAQTLSAAELGIGIHQHPRMFSVPAPGDPHDEIFQHPSRGDHPVNGKLIEVHPGAVLMDKVPDRVADVLAQHLSGRHPQYERGFGVAQDDPGIRGMDNDTDRQILDERPVGLLFRPQGSLGPLAVADVTDIALDDLFIADQIHVADEFHLDQTSALCLERQVFVANKLILLQRQEGIPAGLDILERADLPELLFHKFLARVAQHIDQIGVDVADRARFGVQYQNAVLGRFEESAVAKLRLDER